MNSQETKKLINNVIDNEFNHIQQSQEREESLNDMEIRAYYENTSDLMDKLLEAAPEHRELIDKFDSELCNYWTALCRYYFKKGIIASSTNLKFLEDTSIIHLI